MAEQEYTTMKEPGPNNPEEAKEYQKQTKIALQKFTERIHGFDRYQHQSAYEYYVSWHVKWTPPTRWYRLAAITATESWWHPQSRRNNRQAGRNWRHGRTWCKIYKQHHWSFCHTTDVPWKQCQNGRPPCTTGFNLNTKTVHLHHETFLMPLRTDITTTMPVQPSGLEVFKIMFNTPRNKRRNQHKPVLAQTISPSVSSPSTKTPYLLPCGNYPHSPQKRIIQHQRKYFNHLWTIPSHPQEIIWRTYRKGIWSWTETHQSGKSCMRSCKGNTIHHISHTINTICLIINTLNHTRTRRTPTNCSYRSRPRNATIWGHQTKEEIQV